MHLFSAKKIHFSYKVRAAISVAAITILVIFNCSVANAASAAITKQLWGGVSKDDVEKLKKIVAALDKEDLNDALFWANSMKGQSKLADATLNLVLWSKYSQDKFDPKKTSFSDISRFVNDNPFFPNLSNLRRNVERVTIANNVPYDMSEQYYKNYPASDTDTKIYLLKSKINYLGRKVSDSEDKGDPSDSKSNASKDVQDSISDIWIKENFSIDDEKKFLQTYGDQLSQVDHIRRMERLIWDDRIHDSLRVMNFIGEDHRRLFESIIEIGKNPKYIDNIILSIPRKLRDSELLYYKRAMWYKVQNDMDKLIKLLEDIPSKTSRPDKWWSLRKLYFREMLKQKEYKTAYIIAANHGLKPSSTDYSDAEWTAGWIALRFLNKASPAYNHFNNLYENVSYPISLSRAAYWLGMAAEGKRDKEKAIEWYKVAIKYPTYFYGQLAIHKHRVLDSIGAQSDIILPGDPKINDSDIISVANSMPVKIAYILALTGDKRNATKIFEYAVNKAKTDGEIAVMMKISNEIEDRELDLKISKFAAKKNVFFIKDKFQVIKEVENDPYAPLVHAIIKQESGFSPSALSSVGAIGFMQIMPGTAKLVCKQMGVKYDKNKLAKDVEYNILLGTFYIKSLIDRFEGSEIMAIASYNAGPNATQRWVDEFYDPRKSNDIDKVVDWIELITYAETRNYVQRIMENLIVYKYIMSRKNYDTIK